MDDNKLIDCFKERFIPEEIKLKFLNYMDIKEKEKNYKNIKISEVYRLKPNSEVWSVDIQESVIFPQEKFVEITNKTYDKNSLFGKIVEPNEFGPLYKSEIHFSIDCLDLKECYENIKEFNKIKRPLLYMDFDFVGFKDE